MSSEYSDEASGVWCVLDVKPERGRRRWVATAHVVVRPGTGNVLRFETTGLTPDEAQARIEEAVVTELMLTQRQGFGRRAYDQRGGGLDIIEHGRRTTWRTDL